MCVEIKKKVFNFMRNVSTLPNNFKFSHFVDFCNFYSLLLSKNVFKVEYFKN